MNVNSVTIIGRLTRDPELRSLPGGTNVANMSVATSRKYTGKDGPVEQTEFHNVVVFGKQADSCAQYLLKGQLVAIEGRLQTRSWDDEGSGKKMYRTEIVAERVQFGPKAQNGRRSDDEWPDDGDQRPEAEQRAAGKTARKTTPSPSGIEYPTEDINPDDIPF